MYVENDRLAKSKELIELIAGFAENLYGDTISCNMLCVHRDMRVRVEGIPEILDSAHHPIKSVTYAEGAQEMKRRDLILGGGFPLIAAGALSTPAAPTNRTSARMSAAEFANIRLVKDYLAAWDSPTVDIDRIVAQYMAPDVLLRWFDDEPTYVGREAAAKAAKIDAPHGVRVVSEILDVFAVRSLVVTSRIDTVKLPEKADQVLKVAGVCVVKKGLIQEYVDYVTA